MTQKHLEGPCNSQEGLNRHIEKKGMYKRLKSIGNKECDYFVISFIFNPSSSKWLPEDLFS